MKKLILMLFIFLNCIVFSEEESVKNTYYEDLVLNSYIKSLGFYFLEDNYGEQLMAFKYKNDIYVVDKGFELLTYGEYSYSFSKDFFIIGMAGAPSGGHNRNIFLFKKEKNNIKLIGHISPAIRDIGEKYPEKDKNVWELEDIDDDGNIEYLVYTYEMGYVFFEVTPEGFVIDYNPENYKKISGRIETKKEKEINNNFINKKIDMKKVESVFILNDIDKYDFKKVEVK